MTILVDSNVVIDLLQNSQWADWAVARFEERPNETFAVNQLIYSESSLTFLHSYELDTQLDNVGIVRLELPWEAGFLAARAFVQYRRWRGKTSSPMPGFYIGAHAVVSGLTLLTRDAKLYRTYFPDAQIIAPR